MGFPCGSAGKEFACNVGDLGLIPGLGRAPGEGKGYPLQDSGLENPMDCIVHGVAKSRTRLSDFHFQSGIRLKTGQGSGITVSKPRAEASDVPLRGRGQPAPILVRPPQLMGGRAGWDAAALGDLPWCFTTSPGVGKQKTGREHGRIARCCAS